MKKLTLTLVGMMVLGATLAMADGDNYLRTLLWLKPWYLFSTKHNNIIHINHAVVTLHG